MPIPQLAHLRPYDIAVPHRVLRAGIFVESDGNCSGLAHDFSEALSRAQEIRNQGVFGERNDPLSHCGTLHSVLPGARGMDAFD